MAKTVFYHEEAILFTAMKVNTCFINILWRNCFQMKSLNTDMRTMSGTSGRSVSVSHHDNMSV